MLLIASSLLARASKASIGLFFSRTSSSESINKILKEEQGEYNRKTSVFLEREDAIRKIAYKQESRKPVRFFDRRK